MTELNPSQKAAYEPVVLATTSMAAIILNGRTFHPFFPMGHPLTLLGIGLMVQSVFPASTALVGFIIFCIGIVLMFLGK